MVGYQDSHGIAEARFQVRLGALAFLAAFEEAVQLGCDRMPVFLPADDWADWLNPAPLDAPAMDETIVRITTASERMAREVTEYEVDRRVNNSRTVDPADPTLVAPVSA